MTAWTAVAAGVLALGGLAVLCYVLVGYPLLLAWAARRSGRPPRVDETAAPPFVSILISAFNETADLPHKIASLWTLDYPPDRFEVLVADDGSADGTAELVERLAAEPGAAGRLRLLPRTENLGKATQLNRLAAEARGEVLCFTDARQPLDPAALARLAAVFSDPEVGGASGAVEYRTAEGQRVPIGAYWRYESGLREREGLLHSVCGSAGPLSAMRAELFQPLPANVVLDDVLAPMRVVLGGHRFVYVGDALAIETYAMNRRHEYHRRVRTLAGNYQVLRLEPDLLSPRRNPIWWQYCSHKVLRLGVPWYLLAILLGSLLGLPYHPLFAVLLALQAVGYLWALLGYLLAGSPYAPKGSSAAYFLVMLAVASVAGLWRDLRGGSQARWGVAEKHRRSQERT